MLPKWALLPAAWKMLLASFRQPKEDLVIMLNDETRRVWLVPSKSMEDSIEETTHA